jgi:hypothetical protein
MLAHQHLNSRHSVEEGDFQVLLRIYSTLIGHHLRQHIKLINMLLLQCNNLGLAVEEVQFNIIK